MGLDGAPLVVHLLVTALACVPNICLAVPARKLGQTHLVSKLCVLLEHVQASALKHAQLASEGIGIEPILFIGRTCLSTSPTFLILMTIC